VHFLKSGLKCVKKHETFKWPYIEYTKNPLARQLSALIFSQGWVHVKLTTSLTCEFGGWKSNLFCVNKGRPASLPFEDKVPV